MLWIVGLFLLDGTPDRMPAAPLDPAEAARREALTRYGLGLWRSRLELPAQALKQFEQAVKADPASPEPWRKLAAQYADLGRDAAAIRAAQKALELDPADAQTAQLLGQLLVQGKQYAAAVKVLKQAAESPRWADQPARRFGALHDLGRAADLANDPTSALEAATAALTLAEKQAPALLRSPQFDGPADLARQVVRLHETRGQALAILKKYPEAEVAYRTAARLATDPTAQARLDWHLSGLLLAQGKLDEAHDRITAVIAKHPSGTAPYERFAEIERRRGGGAEVPAQLARLAEQNPKNPSARWVVAVELGKNDQAAGDRLFKELAESTTDPAFFTMLVHHLREIKRPDMVLEWADRLYSAARGGQADDAPPDPAKVGRMEDVLRAQRFTAAIKAEPTMPLMLTRFVANNSGLSNLRSDTWDLIARCAEHAGQVATAEQALTNALRQGNLEAFNHLYRLLYRQRKWQTILGVIDMAEGAERRRPAGGGRLYDYYRATPLAEMGRAAEALAAIGKAIANAKNPLSARMERARVLCILGRFGEAYKDCQEALLDAQTPADVRQVRVVLANSLLGLKKYPEAEEQLRAILEDDPDDVLALNNLGYNLADQGRKIAEAEQLVRRAIELDEAERIRSGSPEPESGTYLDSLGWVLFRAGKLEEARTVLEKAANSFDAGTDAVVWDHLGDVRFRLGDRAGAKQAWQKAVELYENSHQGREAGRRDEAARKARQ